MELLREPNLHDVHHDPSDDDGAETSANEAFPGLVGRKGRQRLVDESASEKRGRNPLATPLETTDVRHGVVPGDCETRKDEPHQSVHDDGDNRTNLEDDNDDR